MLNKQFKFIDMVKWFSLVGSIAFSLGAAKKGGMNFLETLHSVQEQNIAIIAGQKLIVSEQRIAKEDRNSLRFELKENTRADQARSERNQSADPSYAQLNNTLNTVEN
jgi:hypothetical protein